MLAGVPAADTGPDARGPLTDPGPDCRTLAVLVFVRGYYQVSVPVFHPAMFLSHHRGQLLLIQRSIAVLIHGVEHLFMRLHEFLPGYFAIPVGIHSLHHLHALVRPVHPALRFLGHEHRGRSDDEYGGDCCGE